MWTRQKKKTRLGWLVVPAIAIVFFSYFGYHAVNGELGLRAKTNLQRRAMELQADLDSLVAEHERLEKQVQLLSRATLEQDMLDERARFLLNVSRPDEIVIYR